MNIEDRKTLVRSHVVRARSLISWKSNEDIKSIELLELVEAWLNDETVSSAIVKLRDEVYAAMNDVLLKAHERRDALHKHSEFVYAGCDATRSFRDTADA